MVRRRKSNTDKPPQKSKSKLNVVFLGDQSVGKTSIITRFMCNKFDTSDHKTTGIDFLLKTMQFEDAALGSVRLKLFTDHLLDATGKERFRSLIRSYITDSDAAVIIYDVASKVTFDSSVKWIKEVRAVRGTDVIIVLVGNKTDLVDKREVEDGEMKASELEVMFIETSAKNGSNIKELFWKIRDASQPKSG